MAEDRHRKIRPCHQLAPRSIVQRPASKAQQAVHIHSHTQAYTLKHSHIHKTYTHIYILTHTETLPHTHSRTHSDTHMYSHTHTQTLMTQPVDLYAEPGGCSRAHSWHSPRGACRLLGRADPLTPQAVLPGPALLPAGVDLGQSTAPSPPGLDWALHGVTAQPCHGESRGGGRGGCTATGTSWAALGQHH